MCGITGYFALSGLVEETGSLRALNTAVAHRGPDGEGMIFIRRDGISAPASFVGMRTALTPPSLPEWRADLRIPHDIALGHRRFAIIDLSEGGHQPFVSKDGSLVLSFNGEIYNYVELREELQRAGHIFETRSDAEVLLHAYRQWGEGCFEKLIGFWALALWDGNRESQGRRGLLLSRDRMGKAPLYYMLRNGRLWWCSEIKGLLSTLGHESFSPRLEAARQFIRAGLRDVGDETFFEGIKTFPRASSAWIKSDGSFEAKTFWTLPTQRFTAREIGIDEAVQGLHTRLQSSVKLRLRADVPMGLELSGGLDSSTIAALAAHERGSLSTPLSAFTVSFPGTKWDEAPYARRVAEQFPGAFNLQTLIPDESLVLRGLKTFQLQMDEPIHSPNMVLNHEIWKRMAALGIRVSLNGAGGDEVFAGYGSEYLGPYLRQLIGRGQPGRLLKEFVLYSERESNDPKSWLRELWLLLPENVRRTLHPFVPPVASDPLKLDRGNIPGASESLDQRLLDHLSDFKMNYWLRSGNTSGMSIPMEMRLPLLDHTVVEWACRLPAEYLIRDGWLKWALRRAMDSSLPKEVTWRPVKMGFPFPLSEWLLQSRPTLEAWCSEEENPFLDRKKLFESYDFLAANYAPYLWRCLSVLLWYDGYKRI